ncbi:MAG: TIGR00304 family membrane protein [Thermoplasmata archaeon]
MNRPLLYAGILTFLISIAFALYGVSRGLMTFGWFIFPVLYGSGPFSALVALLIIASMFLIFISFIEDEGSSKVEYGGAILIGPLPIVFGSSGRSILLTLIILALFIIFLIIIFL